MIQAVNKIKHGGGARTVACAVLVLIFHYTSHAQLSNYKRANNDAAVKTAAPQDDTMTKADSLAIAKEYGKSAYGDRVLYLWNRKVSNRENISSAATIYAADIRSTPVRDITNIMSGRLPGLYTLQLSGQSGADGSDFSIRSRTPLIVIDGVVRQFTNFNPDDIKSITVLKDATATAMWGLRGANGVINIVTKDMAESDFDLNFSAQTGIMEPLARPKFLNAYQYGTLYNEAQRNDNPTATPRYSDSLLTVYRNGSGNSFLSPDVNWYQTVLKNRTRLSRYSADMGGYGSGYHYHASLEHYRQSGNFITDAANAYNTTNSYKRYNVRLNAAVNFNKNISMSLNLFGSLVNAAEPGVSVSTLMSAIYSTPPLAYAIRNPDGSYAGSSTWQNNIYASTVKSGYRLNNERTINEDVRVNYNFQNLVPGLWASAMLSVNNYYYEQINRSKTLAVYQYTPAATPAGKDTYTKFGSDGIVSNGSYSQKNQYAQTYYNCMIGYDKVWSDQQLNILGTFNVDNASYTSLSQLNAMYKTIGLTAAYRYKEKYLAELAATYSGMNFYPPGKQWGFLPALTAGWVISKEPFFHSGSVDLLKLRSSIGLSAWADPGYYPWLQGYTINTAVYNIGSTSASVSGAYETSVANPEATWEKAVKWDAGVELGLFGNQLNIAVDYYRNRHYDQLISPANVSGIFGQSYPSVNTGKVNYYGAELSLDYTGKAGKGKYFVKGNISLANSKVINADEPAYPYSWMYRQGLPVNRTMGYEAIGFYQQGDDFAGLPHTAGYTPQAGDIKYRDLNGDGTINFLDKTALGSAKASVFYGLNLGYTLKGFDISALLQGVQNRNVYVNPVSAVVQEFAGGFGNVQSFHLQRWTPATAATALYPRLSVGGNQNNTEVSSFWMRNGSYLRLKNIELGYSLPDAVLKSIHVKQVRFFINAYNLVTWSKVKSLNIDPESGTNSLFANQRVINGGISVKL